MGENEEIRLPEMDLGIGKLVNYYALMMFHNYKRDQAKDLTYSKTYDELNKITHIDYFMNLAKQGFEKFFLTDGVRINGFDDLIHSEGGSYDEDFLRKVKHHVDDLFDNDEMKKFDSFMKMLDYMNKTRILENTEDDFYDNPTEWHKVLRNLPLELAGIDEANNYATIASGFMHKCNLIFVGTVVCNIKGDKRYLQFELGENAEMFYSVSVLNFLEDRNIRTRDNLRDYLKNIGDNFEPLNPKNAPKGKKQLAEQRLKQITDNKFVEKLTDYLMENNTYIQEIFDELDERDSEQLQQ